MKDKFITVFVVAALVQMSICEKDFEAFQNQLNILSQQMEIVLKENTKLSIENAALREDVVILKDAMLKPKREDISDESRVSSNDKRLLMSSVDSQAPGVAFSARQSVNYNLGVHETVKYETVITNTGNAYNPNLGTFTAPVKGLYMFSASICTLPDQRVHLNIVKEGTPVAFLYSHDNGWDLGSQTVVIQLEKGDEIWVQHDAKYDLSGKATLAGEFNTFSGILVHKMIT